MAQYDRQQRTLRVILERGDDPALVTWLSSQFGALFQRLDNLEKHLVQQDTRLDLMETNIMATLDQVRQDIQDETAQIAGLSTFIAGLKQQIADALAGVTLPPAVQAKVDEIFAGAEANKTALASAMATSPTGQPLPAPPVVDPNSPLVTPPDGSGASTPPAGSSGGGL